MSYILTVELSDRAYAVLEGHAQAAATTPAKLAVAALEQRFKAADKLRDPGHSTIEADRHAARERFERHFGAVNLGVATGVDNEEIDADLARAYADDHGED